MAPTSRSTAASAGKRQNVRNRDRRAAFKLKQNWAPRVGFIWDVARTTASKLYANWGRFYESIPMDINIRAFGGELQCFCYNFSPTPPNFAAGSGSAARDRALLGGSTEPVDPNLKGQYIDEWLGGFEYELGARISSSASRYTHRKLGRVIEDFLIPAAVGEYFIANPGSGHRHRDGLLRLRAHGARAAGRSARNDAFELHARSASPTTGSSSPARLVSKLEGNYDGTFQASTGPARSEHQLGVRLRRLPGECARAVEQRRKHQLKFDGSYEFSSGPVDRAAVRLSARTGTRGLPLNAYGYLPGVQQLGVLPGAARIGGHADRGTGKRTCTSPIRSASAARAGST